MSNYPVENYLVETPSRVGTNLTKVSICYCRIQEAYAAHLRSCMAIYLWNTRKVVYMPKEAHKAATDQHILTRVELRAFSQFQHALLHAR